VRIARTSRPRRGRFGPVPPSQGFWTSEGYTPMLVLSRKKNESIVINNDILITVVEIRGDKVRLGIVAPKDVPVHRQEVYEAIHGHRPDAAPSALVVNPDPNSGRM
jgi:carbon storage regulator